MKVSVDDINKDIISIWRRYPDKRGTRAPLLYDEFETGGLLYVGFNPSFAPKEIKNFLKGTVHKDIAPTKFYRWGGAKHAEKRMKALIEIERIAKTGYGKYFNAPRKLTGAILGITDDDPRWDSIDNEWQHIDLFLFRKTRQDKKLVWKQKDKKLTPFGKRQFEVFVKLVRRIKPRIIVVINATASHIIMEHYDPQPEWHVDKGYHKIKVGGKSRRIFFTSMISGQRQLDVHSRERLQWHIVQAESGG